MEDRMDQRRWLYWRIASILWHLLMFITFLFALIKSEVAGYNRLREEAIFNVTHVDKRFMDEWKYLTRWDHMLQLTFYLLCLVADVISAFKWYSSRLSEDSTLMNGGSKSYTFKSKLDFFFHTLCVPVAICVSTLYWSLKMINPSMLSGQVHVNIPKSPVWLDHILHTLVTVAAISEFFLTYHKRPSRWLCSIVPVGFLMVYFAFEEWLIFAKGFAVYNIFLSPWWVVTLLVIAVVIYVFSLAYVFDRLHEWHWTEKKMKQFEFGLSGFSKNSEVAFS